MEIIGVELLEVIGFGGRLEQHAAKTGIVVHGPAGVHQQQDLHRVLPGVFVLDLQKAAVLAGVMDGAVDIQFLLGALGLNGQLPQQAEGHLELAGVQLVVLAEIPKLPLSGYKHGGVVAALAADADAMGAPTAVAPGGVALGANPVVAAVVLLLLLLEPLFQQIQELLQRLLRKVLGPQLFDGQSQVIAWVVQPVQQLLRQFALEGHVLEKLQEHLVEAVVLRLVLDDDGPAQLVKARQGGVVQPLLHGLQQRQPLVQGHVQPPAAQQVEKCSKHRPYRSAFRRFCRSLSFFSSTPAKGISDWMRAGSMPPATMTRSQSTSSDVLGFFSMPRSSRTQ